MQSPSIHITFNIKAQVSHGTTPVVQKPFACKAAGRSLSCLLFVLLVGPGGQLCLVE